MKSKPEKLNRVGTFTVTPGGTFLGTLLLNGQNSSLYLRDDKPFSLDLSADTKITGVLDDQTTVSILGDWDHREPSYTLGPGGPIYFYNLSPRYVILDNQEISNRAENISSIKFIPEDWEPLFGGSHPFGFVWNDRATTEQLVKSETSIKEPDLGKHQAIFYWTGKNNVLTCHTEIGKVSAFHALRTSTPTARGFQAESEVCVEIQFYQPVTFDSAIDAMFKILMFFDYLVGRVQNYSGLAIRTVGEDMPVHNVHSCIESRRSHLTDGFGLGLRHSLMSATRDIDRFGQVLSRWTSRESGWSEARWNLLKGWRGPDHYDSDRIVRSANLFDLIPSNSFPKYTEMSDEMKTILSRAKNEISKLPEGIDKSRIMTSLGMAGKYVLKQRILYRAEMVSGEFGDEVPEIKLVCRYAGDCRNRYVHGTPSQINMEKHSETFVFLIDTLEFVFAVSDLIDAGWKVSDWQRFHASSSHRFHSYLRSYRNDLEKLKTLLNE